MLGYWTCLGFFSPPKSNANFCYKPSGLFLFLFFVIDVMEGGGNKYLSSFLQENIDWMPLIFLFIQN